MSGLTGFAIEQDIAAFALHALWQVPVLAGAAALAIRIGRPHVRTAHVLWVVTLFLCVLAPAVSTVMGHRAAVEAARADAAVSISFESSVFMDDLPPMQRVPAWKLALRRHVLSPAPFAFTLSPRVARSIAWAYLVIAFAFATRLFLGWRRTRLLVRAAAAHELPPAIANALQRQCDAIGCEPPHAALTEDLPGPALAGVLQPTLLMPADSAAQMSPAEIDAVLAHELAHLRRGDPMLHAACSLLLLPVSFHPAAAWAGRRVRQTREMACDAEAAERLGSAAEYARALLLVAERSNGMRGVSVGLGLFGLGMFGLGLFDSEVLHKASVRDRLLRQGRGPATAGLQLFGTAGAMEERMQTMMKSNRSENGAKRVARTVAAVSLAAVAVLAAAMVQVQPALAHEQDAAHATTQAATSTATSVNADPPNDSAPALISGNHAREQLRNARHQLEDAQKSSTSDEERSRLAAAQEVIATAEHELAAASGNDRPDIRLDMRDFRMDPQTRMDLDKMHAEVEKQLAAAEGVRAQMNSPAFKAQIKKQIADAERMRAQFNSPEFKARLEKQRMDTERMFAEAQHMAADVERMRAETDTPEFREKIQAQVDAARKLTREQIDALQERARQQREVALSQRNAQMDKANRLVARNEMPPLPPAPQDPHKLVKVEGGIIAGQIINKTQPRYPQSAKDAHISGAVVLHAIIDETGKVQQLAIVSSPDKSLSQSAIEAVQQWTYRPYLLNGNPTSVDTTITVNYSFASGSTNAPPGPVFPSGQSELKPVKGEAYKVHALYKVRPDSWQDELDRQTVRDAHISGSVVMHVLIDETGKVAQISVLSSPDKSLNEPSMNSVRKWAYEPYVVNGKPIAVESTVTVNYSSMYAQSRSDAGLRQDKPKLLTKVDPIYPRSARVNSVKGEVVLGVVVGATGKVNSVRTVSSPDAELSAAAMDAVKQWTFQPAQRDGVAVATTIPIAVNFNY